VLARVVKESGYKPKSFVGFGGDSTSHAAVQRDGLVKRLVKLGMPEDQAWIFGCIRHFVELEIKAFLEAGWPGAQAENFLFAFRDVMHKDVAFWRNVWIKSLAPVETFDEKIGKMPVPTSSKWECLPVPAGLFLGTLHVSQQRKDGGGGLTMMEEFLKEARRLLRGTRNQDRPQDAGTHGDKVSYQTSPI